MALPMYQSPYHHANKQFKGILFRKKKRKGYMLINLEAILCEKFHQLLAVGRWFPLGTPVSSTRQLISSSFHRLDMTLAVAEALNPNTPNQTNHCATDTPQGEASWLAVAYTQTNHCATDTPQGGASWLAV